VFDVILESASRLCRAPLAYLSMANPKRTQVTVPAHRGARPEFAASLDGLSVPIEGSKLLLVRSITESAAAKSGRSGRRTSTSSTLSPPRPS